MEFSSILCMISSFGRTGTSLTSALTYPNAAPAPREPTTSPSIKSRLKVRKKPRNTFRAGPLLRDGFFFCRSIDQDHPLFRHNQLLLYHKSIYFTLPHRTMLSYQLLKYPARKTFDEIGP